MALFLTILALAYAVICLVGWAICAIAGESDRVSEAFGHKIKPTPPVEG
jgi:hypothetical protein